MSNKYTEWLCRISLLILLVCMIYITLLPAYNFAHFVPHNLFRAFGIPYQYMLSFENHMDKLLHFFGALILLMLIFGAKFVKNVSINGQLLIYFLIIVSMASAAEIIQHHKGRGFDWIDLLLGIAGAVFGSILCLIKNNKQKDD